MVTYALPVTEEEIPTTYEEAAIHADSVEWEKAMGQGDSVTSQEQDLGVGSVTTWKERNWLQMGVC